MKCANVYGRGVKKMKKKRPHQKYNNLACKCDNVTVQAISMLL